MHAVLHTNDIGQLGLSLDGEEGNPQAVKEVEQFISLRASGNDRLLVSDIIERFSKRPFGWPDGEILLILGRLAALDRISFHSGASSSMALPDAFDGLQNSRRRREISVLKKRQTDDNLLKQARNLTQELFNALGPAAEKELFEFYLGHVRTWRDNLKTYKSKTDVSHLPGKSAIEQALLSLERLLSNHDSVDFFKVVTDDKATYLDLEEDYRDLHEFFTNQLHTWQQLQQALRRFDKNKQALEKDHKASKALTELRSIDSNPSPFNRLHKVAALVETVESINSAILSSERSLALVRVDEKIAQLQAEIAKSAIETPELSNRLLRPLQLLKADLETETSIANIYMLQTQTADDRLQDGVFELERAIQAESDRQQKLVQEQTKAAAQAASTADGMKPKIAPVPAVKPVAPPKPVVDIAATSIFNKLGNGIYLESQADIERFIDALKAELEAAIKQDQRIRIR